mgnify:CR=1 FL=1
MKLSHSKLQTILTCPMTYYLQYKEGISLKIEKPALVIGSAVHWGIEHNTDDLSKFFEETGSFKIKEVYSKEHLMAESMVSGYLKLKDEIFDNMLRDENNQKLELLNEEHELFLEADLDSYKDKNEKNKFVGIIDLLLLTNKGFIVIDYKTSSQTPDWSKYLEQIYRYIYLLRKNFKDVPIYKIGIINLKKSLIKIKKNENEEEFSNRLKKEYLDKTSQYIIYHEYNPSDLDPKIIDEYINNLSKMADLANDIDKKEMWYINYSNADGVYGKSPYYDIFYKTDGNYLLYKIKDSIYDAEEDIIKNERDCVPIDMLVIDENNILNKYEKYEEEVINVLDKDANNFQKEFIDTKLKKRYKCDNNLLDKYYNTFCYKLGIKN